MKLKFAALLIFISWSTTIVFGDRFFWKDEAEISVNHSKQERSSLQSNKQINTIKHRTLRLDEAAFKNVLDMDKAEIDLPLPQGGFSRVKIEKTSLLSAELALNYPEIKTWRVKGVDDPSITGVLDFTAKGFHGMLVLADGDTVYIDPDKDGVSNIYHSLSAYENAEHFKSNFSCKEHSGHLASSGDVDYSKSRSLMRSAQHELAQLPVQDLITYRLALAGTAEYTASQGGTKSLAYASMVTTINRVNEVLQRDTGVKLQLVTGEQLLYLDAATDPYTNNNLNALLYENTANTYNVIGLSNYDIGHVFSTGGSGGLAYVEAACVGNVTLNDGTEVLGLKAAGASGSNNPQGEIFNITLVAHEIGHQLGATHTFNGIGGSCGANQTAATAVEPGGGSTIMSYSGICAGDSLQGNADAMYHWASINQINNYTRVAPGQNEYPINGTSCGTRTTSAGQNPTANAGADAIIPKNTPFLLHGLATNGNSYAWDQVDAGTPSAVDVDKGDNAIIRSLLPSINPDRYIPRLLDLFTGSNTTGEILPQTVRDVNFAFVVRDGNGGVAVDNKKISTIDNNLVFKVLSHSVAQTLFTEQSTQVTWSIAGTNNAPINCSKVDIQLLRSDGVKNTLLLNTDNDGTEIVMVPALTPAMTNARIMVACTNQPFFQISAGDIEIQQGTDVTPPVITLTGPNPIEIHIGTSYVDLGATATDNYDITALVTITDNVDVNTLGIYEVTYSATDNASNTSTIVRTVKVINDVIPPVITLVDNSVIDIVQGQVYVELGATALDNVDGNVVVSVSGSVDTSIPGVYTITYRATDSRGNSVSIDRTVEVVPSSVSSTATSSGGGSIGYTWLMLMFVGLYRRRILQNKVRAESVF